MTILGSLGEGGGGSPKKKYLYWGGGHGNKLITGGGVMQLFNDTSKNPTSPPYLVKNERSLIRVLKMIKMISARHLSNDKIKLPKPPHSMVIF